MTLVFRYQMRTVEDETAMTPSDVPEPPTSAGTTVLKASIGGGAVAISAAYELTKSAGRVVRPLGGVVKPLGPSLMHRTVPTSSMTPEMVIRHLVMRGNHVLEAAEEALDVVSRELVPTATDALLERVDLTDLVMKRVDLVRIIDTVLDRIDLTHLVLQHVDLDRIIAAADLDAAAARLDVDAVAQRLDVDAVAARLDVNAVVARLDPVAMTESIAEAIELPEIIKTTGSVATGAVREAGVQGTEAYGQAKRVVGRVPHFLREPELELEPTP